MANESLGQRVHLEGYVTTMASIAGKSARDVERALGFDASTLASGFYVYALVDVIGIADFEWMDQTAYSAGWRFDPFINEFVQRSDELRAQLGKLNQYDEAQTDAKIREIMLRHVARLNVRVGPERIVKVKPKVPRPLFPPAHVRNIPQWRLRSKKSFMLLADVMAGGGAPAT